MPNTASKSLPTVQPSRPWLRVVLWALIVAVLAAVFMLYTQPEFMVRMADHVWACF
ncbi:hypothetical protein ACFIQF_07220 [Comamonas sp. J-3]|uniref:hypothetical protein n=1 Tax=Comamonas trifloxystrobinivorans TaxID=3350256 RepID=UPI003728B3B2